MLPKGLYDRLLDEDLQEVLMAHPDMVPSLAKIEEDAEPDVMAQFVRQILKGALPQKNERERVLLLNRLIQLLAECDGLEYTQKKCLLTTGPQHVLRQVRQSEKDSLLPEPETSLRFSSLLTGSADDPQLERELRSEMMSADRVDILVSFIKWSGLQLLMPAFEEMSQRGVPVRIITTSYMGASDPAAVEWLARQPSFKVRVSYDTERTRLHAKAYHFVRNSGFSTAYIGSANMSRPAMTSGLEWTVKVTAQDMPHVLQRFAAEFETYWLRDEFLPFDPEQPELFRQAVQHARKPSEEGPRFFLEIQPRAFQERILEALVAEREAGFHRNLVISATGTGKTFIAAFDYTAYRRSHPTNSRLLFVVHRKEILQQARDCFRAIVRDFNMGELLVDGQVPEQWDVVFASVQSLNTRKPWQELGTDHFDFVIVDEAHHGIANSYRPLFEHLRPKILLGLTATPERMDGSSILPDFDHRFAAEIRLPEALEEKLLCPFHYFGVTDPISTADESFWRNGRYDVNALEAVYTGDDLRAINRLNAIFKALARYQPVTETIRGIGFCAGVKHAKFMAARFKEKGITSEMICGETPREERNRRISEFREGRLRFLFTVDIFNEGVDIPEINLVLFLRPTESLTVFLQQLGRGLRHAPEKDCLTVIDFVGQTHRKYRIDRKFSALLSKSRRRIDEEVERDFPNLPPGCNIQLERVAREHVLENIRHSLGNLSAFVPEVIKTMTQAIGRVPEFGEFIAESDLNPLVLLKNRTWSEWKALAMGTEKVKDPQLHDARRTLRRVCRRTDPVFLERLAKLTDAKVAEEASLYNMSPEEKCSLHYTLWSKSGKELGFANIQDSIQAWKQNRHSTKDLGEVIRWRCNQHPFPSSEIDLGYPCALRLHAAYGYREITAAFGLATLERTGPTGVGVIHIDPLKTYLHFVTFRKEDKDFAPTTRYKDYAISRRRLHWESQAAATQSSISGQNYIHWKERGYQILFFARMGKNEEGEPSPFLFLGPADKLISYESNRPIQMIWELANPMPAELYEKARTV